MHGKDFIVSLGTLWKLGLYPKNPTNDRAYNRNLAGTFMHELGHNFGLRHGGGDEDVPNYKPNYLSVMNYRYQFNGILRTSGESLIDYSRQALNTLDESQLDERVGLGSNDPNLEFTFMDATCTPRRAKASGPVDWSGQGTLDSIVTADLNPQEDPSGNCGDVSNSVMLGHEDWSTLDYGFYDQMN